MSEILQRQSAVIDRIVDEQTAVLHFAEDNRELLIPVEKLPQGSQEGHWLFIIWQDGQLVEAVLDLEKTEKIKERVQSKRAILLQRSSRRRQR